jgi:glycosyltransferase involved in cell wall biosynthesis
METTISVIMPLYNAGKYLKDSVESILYQSYTKFELLIIDDASRDESIEILKELDDPRIIIHQNDSNMGNAWCRNFAVQKARGTYIAFMDSDDISHKDRLEKQYRFLQNNPEIGITGSFIEVFNENKSYTRVFPVNPVFIKAFIFCKNPLAQPSVMIRKEILLKHRLRHIIYFEDYHLWYQASKHIKISNIPEVLLRYRFSENAVKNRHRMIKDHSVRILFLHKLRKLDVHIQENEFEIFADFMRGKKISLSSGSQYRYFTKKLREIGDANTKKGIYPHSGFKACILYDRIRLCRFFYSDRGIFQRILGACILSGLLLLHFQSFVLLYNQYFKYRIRYRKHEIFKD